MRCNSGFKAWQKEHCWRYLFHGMPFIIFRPRSQGIGIKQIRFNFVPYWPSFSTIVNSLRVRFKMWLFVIRVRWWLFVIRVRVRWWLFVIGARWWFVIRHLGLRLRPGSYLYRMYDCRKRRNVQSRCYFNSMDFAIDISTFKNHNSNLASSLEI